LVAAFIVNNRSTQLVERPPKARSSRLSAVPDCAAFCFAVSFGRPLKKAHELHTGSAMLRKDTAGSAGLIDFFGLLAMLRRGVVWRHRGFRHRAKQREI